MTDRKSSTSEYPTRRRKFISLASHPLSPVHPAQREPASQRSRRRHHIAALFAGAEFLAVKKAFVSHRDRIFSIIVHDEFFFVQKLIALRAIPMKAIDLARPSLAFGDQGERLG